MNAKFLDFSLKNPNCCIVHLLGLTVKNFPLLCPVNSCLFYYTILQAGSIEMHIYI